MLFLKEQLNYQMMLALGQELLQLFLLVHLDHQLHLQYMLHLKVNLIDLNKIRLDLVNYMFRQEMKQRHLNC